MRERQRRREITYALEVNADVDLAWGDAVDADAGALEGGDAGPDDAKGRVRRHRVAGAPAAAVHRSHAADDDDAAVFLRLGRCVRVASPVRQLPHRRRRVLEREERRH